MLTLTYDIWDNLHLPGRIVWSVPGESQAVVKLMIITTHYVSHYVTRYVTNQPIHKPMYWECYPCKMPNVCLLSFVTGQPRFNITALMHDVQV
jgi:hypothetical protein